MFFSIHFILFLVAKNALLTVGFIRNKYMYPHVKKQAACHNRFFDTPPLYDTIAHPIIWGRNRLGFIFCEYCGQEWTFVLLEL